MAEATEQIVETPTAAANELKAKTDAALKAVTGGGFNDPDFEAGLQAAIDKDLGKAPPESAPAAVPKDAATPGPPKPAIEIPNDLPPELLGEKPPEKKPEPDEAAKAEAERIKFIEEQTKGMTPKAAERFKKIELRAFEAEQRAKKVAEEKEAEKAALQKEIQTLALKAAASKEEPSETEAMKKRLEELESIISKNAIAEDPRFKAKYDGQIENEINNVKKLVTAESADELTQLMVIPVSKKRNERIKEIVEELDDIDRVKVLASLERIDRVSVEKANELTKWKENKVHVDALNLRQQQEQAAKQKEIQELAIANGIAAVSSPDTGLEVFRKINGNDEWNAKVDARLAAAQRLVTSQELPPAKIVEMAAKSVAADEYRQMFLAQRVLVKRLAEEIAELKKAEPSAGDDTGSAAPPVDKRSFVDAAVQETVKAGGLRE